MFRNLVKPPPQYDSPKKRKENKKKRLKYMVVPLF